LVAVVALALAMAMVVRWERRLQASLPSTPTVAIDGANV